MHIHEIIKKGKLSKEVHKVRDDDDWTSLSTLYVFTICDDTLTSFYDR